MRKWLPWLLWAGCALWLASSMREHRGPLDIEGAGRLPVLAGGRVKPMDTVARTSLLILHGKQSLEISKTETVSAMEWLLEVMAKPGDSNARRFLRIDNPDVLGLMGLQQTREKYFSFEQLKPHIEEIERQAKLADPVESGQRSLFQTNILKLYNQLHLYQRLKNTLQVEDSPDLPSEIALYEKSAPAGMQAVREREAGRKFDEKDFGLFLEFADRYRYLSQTSYAMVIPPPQSSTKPLEWMNMGEGLLRTVNTGHLDSTVALYADLVAAHRNSDNTRFKQATTQLRSQFRAAIPHELSRTDFEFSFNRLQPFYKSMVLYVAAFVLILFSWLVDSKGLNRIAFHLLLIALVIHTFGLVARMYIQGRPPVTNLYSSAIFVGWGAVVLGMILEKIHRNGIGAITAATLGFLTLLVAHNLAADGDTMEMLRAVLDTNYWLATHVVVVTLGYASTFLAGFLALVYIIRRFFHRLDERTAQSLGGMVYGILCFATLFSFVGTVLGGIWADQSWGRFWGWDPKENGALIIVLWNALTLHARWGGMIRERGLIVMAVFGNIVTSFSWFGVNMLGVGLHSYGFIDKAFYWLALFVLSQLAMMALAFYTAPLAQKRPSRGAA